MREISGKASAGSAENYKQQSSASTNTTKTMGSTTTNLRAQSNDNKSSPFRSQRTGVGSSTTAVSDAPSASCAGASTSST